MRGVNTLRLRKGHPSCDRWMLSSRIKSKLKDGKEALSTSRGDQSFPVSHRARSPVVLKKLAGNQRTPLARNYWPANDQCGSVENVTTVGRDRTHKMDLDG